MRIAFYAPLKPPTHGTPSGDRRVAGLLMDALARAGHRVQLASTFRTYDGDGDAARQRALRAHGSWALGHEATAAAIRKAALVISPSRDDIAGLRELIDEKRILHLPPFLDAAPYAAARAERAQLRAQLAAERALDP